MSSWTVGDQEVEMEPRVDVITLAVGDLERALAFYRALGLTSPGVIGSELVGGYFRGPDGHLWVIIWNPRRGGGA
jgi:predicted lactoylglutathione lyase